MKSRHLSFSLALLPVFLLACGGEQPTPDGGSQPIRGRDRTAIVAISSDISDVNPLLAQGQVSRDILDQVFLRLFAEQPDYAEGPPTFEPELAESWTWSDDGRTLTLNLRRDVNWSDGVPVTAEDVAWSLDAQTDPAVAWQHADSRERIEGFRALDEHTVEVRFRNPYPGRLSDLNEGPIMPRHLWGRVPFSEWRRSGEWFRDNMLANGPFRLARWKPQAEIVLERNPSYYREGYPRLDRVVLKVVPARSNRLAMLLSGQIDFVSGLRPFAAPKVETSDAADLIAFWHRQYHFIVWNGCRPPFDDPIIRRALTLAVDRSTLVEAVYSEHAKVAVSPILSSTWAFAEELEPWPWDPKEAKRLLASRGFIDSDGDGILDRDGEDLSVTLMTNSGNSMRVDMATMALGYLQEVGVDAELRSIEFAVFRERLMAHDFSAALSSWATDTSFDLKGLFHSSAVDTRQNIGCYRNPEVDRLIDLARLQTDPVEMKRYLVELQKILHRDQPYTWVAEVQRLSGVSSRLHDARPNPLDTFGALEEWWMASPE